MSESFPTGQHTLFVGDLSIFCTEEHLREAFGGYGELVEVKIIRCEETKKNLSYGFVKYAETESAVKAIEELDGAMVCGRPLRIGWASRRSRYEPMASLPFNQKAERSSVHVTYTSYQVDNLVTEEFFVRTFGKYGEVIDAAVKRFEINEELRFQKGYGFVHFAYTPEGVASALKCCDELHNRTVEKVTYKCSISHRLKQCMDGTAEEEEQYGMDYCGDYGAYPQVLMVNPMSMPGIPMGYACNSAGVMVPIAMAVQMGDSYQYMNPFVAMNQYQMQLQTQMQQSAMQGQQGQPPTSNISPTFGPMTSSQMFPYGFPQQYPAQMSNMQGMLPYGQRAAYYNQVASATGPYSWQYLYCNSAGEQTLPNGAYSLEQSHQQTQQGHQYQLQQAPHNAHTNGAADGTANSIVTGFAVQKPSAAAIAAAVHGDVGFVYASPGSVSAYANNVLSGGGDSVYGFHLQHQYSAHAYDHTPQYQHQQGGGQGSNGTNAKSWAALFTNNNGGNGGSNGYTDNVSGNVNVYSHSGSRSNQYPVAQAQMSAAPTATIVPATVNAGAQPKLPFSVGSSAQHGNGAYPPPQRTSTSGYASGNTSNGYSTMANNFRNRRGGPIRTIPITTVHRSHRTSAVAAAPTARASGSHGTTQKSAGSAGSADSSSGINSPDSEASEQSYASSQNTTSEDTALDSTPVLPESQSGGDTATAAEGGANVPAARETFGETMIVVGEVRADGANGTGVNKIV